MIIKFCLFSVNLEIPLVDQNDNLICIEHKLTTYHCIVSTKDFACAVTLQEIIYFLTPRLVGQDIRVTAVLIVTTLTESKIDPIIGK